MFFIFKFNSRRQFDLNKLYNKAIAYNVITSQVWFGPTQM